MGEEPALKAIQALSSLEKTLTSLSNLPLPISYVEGVSAVFRYTQVFPPLPTTQSARKSLVQRGKRFLPSQTQKQVPNYVAPLQVSIQLSSSGKWPDDLQALRMTKAAYNIQIAECLRKQHGLQALCNDESILVYVVCIFLRVL